MGDQNGKIVSIRARVISDHIRNLWNVHVPEVMCIQLNLNNSNPGSLKLSLTGTMFLSPWTFELKGVYCLWK